MQISKTLSCWLLRRGAATPLVHITRHCWRYLAACVLLIVSTTSVSALDGRTVHFTHADVYTADNGSFAIPDSVPEVDTAAVPWQRQELPLTMPRALSADSQEIVTTWIRLPAVELPSSWKAPTLYVPRWQTIGKIAVYVNGSRVEYSRGGPVWNGYNHPLWIQLPVANEGRLLEILVRLDHLRSAGGAVSTVWVGDQASLQSARVMRELLQAKVPEISSAAFLILGIFALGVWARRRHESLYILFFLSSVVSYVRCLHYYVGLESLLIPEAWFGWLTVNSAGWLVITVYCFAFRMHGRRYPRLEIGIAILTLIASLITLPALSVIPDISRLTPLAYLIILGVVVILSVVMCFASWRSQSREGLILSGWNLLNIPLIAHDWMLQNYLIDIEHIYLVPYSILGTCFIFMALVLRRYLGALNDMEQANLTLENRLREREAQLEQSYRKLREAENERVLIDERQRLMRDMHDGFGSALVNALMAVEQDRSGKLDVADILRECIDDLKLTIDSLEPLNADLLLLLASLRYRLGPRLDQAGITLHWDVEDELRLEWLSPGSALQILRMLQEMFTNIVKHAQASKIWVKAMASDDAIVITVEDNGKGFSCEAVTGGRGLANLKHRARGLQASVQWDSVPGRTRFQLSLPLQTAPATA